MEKNCWFYNTCSTLHGTEEETLLLVLILYEVQHGTEEEWAGGVNEAFEVYDVQFPASVVWLCRFDRTRQATLSKRLVKAGGGGGGYLSGGESEGSIH